MKTTTFAAYITASIKKLSVKLGAKFTLDADDLAQDMWVEVLDRDVLGLLANGTLNADNLDLALFRLAMNVANRPNYATPYAPNHPVWDRECPTVRARQDVTDARAHAIAVVDSLLPIMRESTSLNDSELRTMCARFDGPNETAKVLGCPSWVIGRTLARTRAALKNQSADGSATGSATANASKKESEGESKGKASLSYRQKHLLGQAERATINADRQRARRKYQAERYAARISAANVRAALEQTRGEVERQLNGQTRQTEAA